MTNNLRLDEDGTLYDGDQCLGDIEDCDLDSPEYVELLDLWLDAKRCDYPGQVRHDFFLAKGL